MESKDLHWPFGRPDSQPTCTRLSSRIGDTVECEAAFQPRRGSSVRPETATLVDIETIRAAAARIAHIAIKTPLLRAPFPGLAGHGFSKEIRLKAESLQPIGAFKMRGAANKILQLTPDEIARGVITYSSGNHAQAVAYAAREVGAKAVIVMPSNAPAIKRAATLALGAEVVDVGVASSERLAMAEKLVREHGYVVIPPYDDEQIIAGQATCGLEIAEEWPEVELVLTPVSGGGLLSGVAAAVKSAAADFPQRCLAWSRSWPATRQKVSAPARLSPGAPNSPAAPSPTVCARKVLESETSLTSRPLSTASSR